MKSLQQLLEKNSLSRLGMGTWNMGENPSQFSQEVKALQCGIDLGMQIIDTAEMYGNGQSERLVSQAIAGRREQVYLISKVLPSHASFHGTIEACERSLANLQTDHMDLYLLHWAGRYPFQETIDAFELLREQGKIGAWGVSNLDVAEMNILSACRHGQNCAANQVLYNLSRRGIEYDLIPWQEQHTIPIIAYSPIEQARLLQYEILQDLALKHQATASQIALAWVLQRPNLIAIPKASRIKHIEENFKSLSINLDIQDYAILDQHFSPPKKKQALEMI